ncbi:MAG TPA: nuclear transport factor 2 family protein [Roseateles sp.]|nr:nuclear transport factor 2 family protein [Roseateles sp.]
MSMTLSNRVSRQELVLAYLRHYAAKDLDAVAAMFAEDIRLRDWKIAVVGKAAAVAETAKNFAAPESIEIHPLALHESADAVAAELRIVVGGSLELYVVDVIAFDAAGRISAIRAYLGRGDA